MPKVLLEVARLLFAVLSLGCIAAICLLDLRSGPTLGLFVLFLFFGAPALLLSLNRPFPRLFRMR